MKIPFSHFAKSIDSNLNINELSDKLFHLGHEHEICDDTFDMEITPNRGDCLSLNGLLRDLSIFYNIYKFAFIYDSLLWQVTKQAIRLIGAKQFSILSEISIIFIRLLAVAYITKSLIV